MKESTGESRYRKRRPKNRSYQCARCGKILPFCWQCRCGFQICMDCMKKDIGSFSCNNIIWICPECNQMNGFGNQ